MNTYKSYISIALIVVMVSAVITSCDLFEERDKAYHGPAKVEFTPTSRSLVLGSDQSGAISVTVQLIGEQQNNALNLNVNVVDSLTTAEANVDYSLPSSSVTIPADSSSVPFNIVVSGENLSPGEVVTLGLVLEGSDGVEAAENLGRFDLTIQGGS